MTPAAGSGHVTAAPPAAGTAAATAHALPPLVQPLFHNYRVDSVDAVRDAPWIILTVLGRGGWEQVRWLFARYGWDGVEAVVRADLDGLRTLPDAAATLWSVVFLGRSPETRTAAQRWAPTRGPASPPQPPRGA